MNSVSGNRLLQHSQSVYNQGLLFFSDFYADWDLKITMTLNPSNVIIELYFCRDILMNLEYYIINGRGEDGSKFQLARLKDDSGNNYKGQYDMARHFGSIDELKTYVADEVVKQPIGELTFEPMNM